MRSRIAAWSACGILALWLGGCAAPEGPATLDIEPGAYARAFEAAKEALRAERFRVERVDARAGVITTLPKASAGLATPWDSEQSSPGQELEDALNEHRRRARVVFAPPQGDAPDDLRDAAGPLVATFEVTLERVQRSGWRPAPRSIRMSSFTTDPALNARGAGYGSVRTIGPDHDLAARLAARTRERLRDR